MKDRTRAAWLLLGVCWISASVLWWSLAHVEPAAPPACASIRCARPDNIGAGVAPTSTRPHLLIATTNGPFGSHIQCFAPTDPAMLGQTLTVPPQDLVPTAHRLCNDPV